MSGLWVISQDGTTIVYVKTFEAWGSGRIVARFGKDWKPLGDYADEAEAKSVLVNISQHIATGKDPVYKMPQAYKREEDYI